MFEDDDYESIDDIARREGFFIDADGNWIPLEDANYDDLEYYGIDRDDLDLLYDEDDDDYNEETDDWEE